jgi:hypothetical protein
MKEGWSCMWTMESPDLALSGFLTFSCLNISIIASKDNNSGQHMNFFQKSEKFWTKSALTFWKRFSENESTDWTDALQQLKNTWNEINNGSLSYS